MKVSTIFKYIFIIFVVAIVSYAGYKIYKSKNNSENQVVENTTEQESIIKDIRLGICGYDTMNPLISNNKAILDIDTLIFEPLFKLSKDYKLEPCLATEWSKTGDNTYVVKIDNTIKWQDGAYLTAKDVQFTIDRLKEGNSIYKANVAHVVGVEVIDATTAKITLDQEVPFFEYNLTFPIMSDLYYFNEDFFNTAKTPIGTGRFKIDNISANSVTLSKNTDWRKISQDESKIDTIKVNLYSSMGEVFNSFKLGNVDLLNTNTQNYKDYIGTIGFNVTESAGREFDFISLNCNDEILQNKYVRQAIGFAIDKNSIITSVYNNQKLLADYPLDYGNFLYTDNNNSSGFNQEKAKQTLTDNGWIYKNNKWKKSSETTTQTLKLKLSVCKENESRMKVAENIKEQLSNVGIAVTIVPLSRDQYNDCLTNKKYQMLLTGIYNSYSPDLTYFFGENNIENYNNEEVLSMINSGISTKNDKGLRENNKKLYNIYKEEMPFIGLYRNKNTTISSQSLVGDIIRNNYSTFYNISSMYRK